MRPRISNPIISITVLFLALFLLQGCGGGAKGEPLRLTVAHINDTHGSIEPSEIKINFNGTPTYTQVGGFPAIIAKLKQLRQEHPHLLFFHAGDVFQGSLYFIKYDGYADLEFLKMMKPVAMCTGNHEFDKGPIVLSRFLKKTVGDFPVVSANIDTHGEPLLQDKIKPYIITTAGTRKIAVIGLTTPQAASISSPGEKLVFNDPIETVRKLVPEITKKGIDIIVVLSHQGYAKDVKLAESVPGLDIVIGGHTHTLLGTYRDSPALKSEGPYPRLVSHPDQGPTLVVQAWEKAKLLGILDVTFDAGGSITHHRGRPVFLTSDGPAGYRQKNAEGKKENVTAEIFKGIGSYISNTPFIEMIAPDAEAQKLLGQLSGPILELKQTEIGHCKDDLFHRRVPGENHQIAGVLEHGSMAAPIVAQALLWKARTLPREKTQIIIQNGGSVRNDISKGPVTIGDVYQLLPFENTLVLFSLEGGHIEEVLESTIRRATGDPDSDGAYPYTAGLRYEVDLSKQGPDFFVRIEVRTETGWVPLEDGKTYQVGANNYIVSGKDGYDAFKAAGNPEDTGFIDAEIFMEYVKAVGTLEAEPPLVTLKR